LLILFDRAVFDAPLFSEEPTEMFRALQQTRLSLQTSGASLVRHQEIAKHFQRIRQILLETEAEVKRRYPELVQLAAGLDENIPVYKRRDQVKQLLGENYWKAVELMMGIRPEITQHVEAIRERLRVLDEQIG
jgi:hypothetical protein